MKAVIQLPKVGGKPNINSSTSFVQNAGGVERVMD